MDSIVQGTAETEAGQFMVDCLHNAVVVRKILYHFSNPELLKLSLVNKLWNCEARGVMKSRGHTIARLDRNGLCHDIPAFAASLHQMNTIPFSGMRIVFPDSDESCQCATALYSFDDDAAFDPLPFRTLSVQLGGKGLDRQDCRGFLLAKKFLQDLSLVIDELSLTICPNPQSFIHHYVQKCTFPRLKILKLEEKLICSFPHEDYLKYFKTLVSLAPNLKELHSDRPIGILLDLVEGTAVEPVYSYIVLVDFNPMRDDTLSSALTVRLQKLELVFRGGRNFNFGRFNRLLPMLLKSSCSTTLCELKVDPVFAASLMCYVICLENVRKLTMGLGHDDDKCSWFHRRVLRFVLHFNFTRMFPNLSKVQITSGSIPKCLPESMKTFIQEASADLSQPVPDRAVNIKELHSEKDPFQKFNMPYFAQMFPNIQRLYINGSYCFADAFFEFGSISKHWANLKEFHVKGYYLEDTANLDCVFSGIFFDEVVQLMQKDAEYLKRVHIVPVMPAVTCLRNLRVLHLEYNLQRRPDPIIYDTTNPMFFLSKVTGLIAFARCPNLTVTLKISPDGAQAVSHLQPYLSVVQ